MITAHLPSGYLLARGAGWRGPVMVAALVGAVWPDLDLLFFYVVDDRAFHHHRYWVHAPAFAIAVTLLLTLSHWRWPAGFALLLAFSCGWGLHILLDSVAGDIMWLWPHSTQLFALFTVPATQANWVLSFLLHWTFLAELVIWAAALTLLYRRRQA